MRIASAVLPLSVLMTAACSSGPSNTQKQDAQTEMQNCILVPKEKDKPSIAAEFAAPVTDITATLDGLASDKIIKQPFPDFTIKGAIPRYEDKIKGDDKDDKEIPVSMDVNIIFASVNGKQTVTLSGSQIKTDDKGNKHNNPFFSQELDIASKDFRGVNVAGMLEAGANCAIQAQSKLGL